VWEKKTVSVPVARLRLEELVARVPDIDRLTGLLVLIVCKWDERDEPVCVCVCVYNATGATKLRLSVPRERSFDSRKNRKALHCTALRSRRAGGRADLAAVSSFSQVGGGFCGWMYRVAKTDSPLLDGASTQMFRSLQQSRFCSSASHFLA